MLTDINSLTIEELKSFGYFINSPYFNRYRTINKLFDYLKSLHPNVTKKDIYEKNISGAVYGKVKVKSHTIRVLVSDFNKLFEKFLIHERAEKDKIENSIILLNEFSKKFLWKSYNKKLSEIKSYSKKEFGIDDKYYLNKLNYYGEYFAHSFTTVSMNTAKISLKKMEYLNLYFVYQTLLFNFHYNSDMYTQKMVKRRPPGMVQFVYDFINEHRKYFSKSYPDIMILYYTARMTETGDIKYFNMLQNYYRRNKKIFDYNITMMYHMASEGFLKTKSFREPDRKNTLKLFIFRKRSIEGNYLENFFREGNNIPPLIFFSMFNEAIKLNQIKWAEEFVNVHKTFLLPQYSKDILNLAEIILDFFKGDYSDINRKIGKVKKSDTSNFIYSRLIKMMMYFETGEFSALRREAESMRKYLDRKSKEQTRFDELIRSSYNFLNSIHYLEKIKNNEVNKSSKKYLQFRQDLLSGPKMPEYWNWFELKLRIRN
ncbi:MAG: hypothetical protein IPM38_08780 [Ignavibacteria bacterium]|nr:hypothetical protein [Ignavibacteria bacterium]